MNEYTKKLEQQLSELEARSELLTMDILYGETCQYCEGKLTQKANELMESAVAARVLLRSAKKSP